MPARRKYEVFVDGDLLYQTDDKQKARTLARFLLEQYPVSKISIREWILEDDEELQ